LAFARVVGRLRGADGAIFIGREIDFAAEEKVITS